MLSLTNDQYVGLSKLEKWYRKYNHQIIEISGVVGTGTWELVQRFIDIQGFDPREVMYLSYDQKQVVELAAKRYHAYYINGIIYNYTRIVDFDTLPVVNPHSVGAIEYVWKKEVRKKIDPRYKLMVVFDSMLLNEMTIRDLGTFGLPIILIRDPMLLPAPDTYTFLRDPNIILEEPHPELLKNPIIYFAHLVLNGMKMYPGNYDIVSVVPKKQMNLYNLKSSNMTITLSDKLMKSVNEIYREKILHQKTSVNIVGERVIVMNNMYGHKLVNKDEKNIKIYLTKGMIGTISKLNKHIPSTKYVPIEFKPEFYFEAFDDLVMDRHYLNKIEGNSRQMVPDEIIYLDYAYALSSPMARIGHWNKITLILDSEEIMDPELQRRLIYQAISKARAGLTIII